MVSLVSLPCLDCSLSVVVCVSVGGRVGGQSFECWYCIPSKRGPNSSCCSSLLVEMFCFFLVCLFVCLLFLQFVLTIPEEKKTKKVTTLPMHSPPETKTVKLIYLLSSEKLGRNEAREHSFLFLSEMKLEEKWFPRLFASNLNPLSTSFVCV